MNMSNELAQFENAARQIEKLLAELGLAGNRLDAPEIGPEWMARVQSILNRAASATQSLTGLGKFGQRV